MSLRSSKPSFTVVTTHLSEVKRVDKEMRLTYLNEQVQDKTFFSVPEKIEEIHAKVRQNEDVRKWVTASMKI